MWQYTDAAEVDGVRGYVDMSYLHKKIIDYDILTLIVTLNYVLIKKIYFKNYNKII